MKKTPFIKNIFLMLIVSSNFLFSWSNGLAITVTAINNSCALLCIWDSSPLISLVGASLTIIDFVGFITGAWLSTTGCAVAVTVSVSRHCESRTSTF